MLAKISPYEEEARLDNHLEDRGVMVHLFKKGDAVPARDQESL
jgi:hypothetical protein